MASDLFKMIRSRCVASHQLVYIYLQRSQQDAFKRSFTPNCSSPFESIHKETQMNTNQYNLDRILTYSNAKSRPVISFHAIVGRMQVGICKKYSVVPFESIQSSLELKTPVARIVSLQTTPLYNSWYPVPGNKTQRTIFNIRSVPRPSMSDPVFNFKYDYI